MIFGKKGQEMGGIIESFPVMFIVFFILAVFVVLSAFLSPFAPEKEVAIFEYEFKDDFNQRFFIGNKDIDLFRLLYQADFWGVKEAVNSILEKETRPGCFFFFEKNGRSYASKKISYADGEKFIQDIFVSEEDFKEISLVSEDNSVFMFKDKKGETRMVTYSFSKCPEDKNE